MYSDPDFTEQPRNKSMKLFTAIAFFLTMPALALAQDSATDEEARNFQHVVQLAAISPDTTDFDAAWSHYVVNHVGPDGDIDGAIDRVMKGANEFRSKMRIPGSSSSGAPMSGFKLRDKMQAVADTALSADGE